MASESGQSTTGVHRDPTHPPFQGSHGTAPPRASRSAQSRQDDRDGRYRATDSRPDHRLEVTQDCGRLHGIDCRHRLRRASSSRSVPLGCHCRIHYTLCRRWELTASTRPLQGNRRCQRARHHGASRQQCSELLHIAGFVRGRSSLTDAGHRSPSTWACSPAALPPGRTYGSIIRSRRRSGFSDRHLRPGRRSPLCRDGGAGPN